MKQLRTKSKKLLSILLVLVMTAQVFSVSAFAEEGEDNSENNSAVVEEEQDPQAEITDEAEADVEGEKAAEDSESLDPEAEATDEAEADVEGEKVAEDSELSSLPDGWTPGQGIRDGGTVGGPTITVKLNDTTITDLENAIAVNNADKLEVRVDFSGEVAGNSYTIDLPDIFLKLSQNVLEGSPANAVIMNFVDLTLTQDANNKQQITITFKEDVIAASFSFVGVLNITSTTTTEERVIEVPGGGTITIKPEYTPSDSGGTGLPGLPSRPDFKTMEGFFLKERAGSTITEKQFVEDKTISNAFYYPLRLNRGQLTNASQGLGVTLNGTIRDALPTGMQLFIPGAPNSGYYNNYLEAYRSFNLYYIETLINKDNAGVFMNITNSATITNAVSYVNKVEAAQGRTSITYTKDDLDTRLNISDSIAEYIKNDDGVYVAYASLYIGYKIINGKIQLYTINTIDSGEGQGEPHEAVRTDLWSTLSNTKCVPLYDTANGEPGTVAKVTPYTSKYFQNVGSGSADSGFSRNYLGKSNTPEGEKYQWEYTYNSKTELILSVIRTPDGQDIFEVETFAGDPTHLLYGKYLTVIPYIYFDQSKWSLPSEGTITFNNTATYNQISKSVSAKYTYNFGSSGAAITGVTKTVDGKEKTDINPEAASTKQTYAISFSKSGALDIAAGSLNVSDILDSHLDYVPGSIKIYYKETSQDDWEDVTAVTDTVGLWAQTAGNSADNLNLRVEYVSSSGWIRIANIGALTSIGQIKVEFDVELKDDAKYGTLVTNYFGGVTVKTYVDHKLTVNKVDESNTAINTGAEFAVQYTTDSDYENGTLESLTDTDGNAVTSLTTGTNGTESVLYRLDRDEFYIKLTETTPPTNYIGISQPIWVKAVRNSVTKEMQYTLEKAPDGVTISVSAKGEVTITVPNVKNTVDRTVRKVWNDNDNKNGKRPESIKVQLYKTVDGTTEAVDGKEIVLDESNGWQYTWTGLPEKESGKEITYSVEEVKVPKDYKVSYSEDTFIITNEEIIIAKILKVDKDGNALKGAKLALYNAEGVLVEEWTSTGTAHVLEDMLEPGVTYTLKELEAPKGYLLAQPVAFTPGVGEMVSIQMEDIKTTDLYSVKVTKYVMYEDKFRSINYSFYAALFWDEACTQRATEVKELKLENSYVTTAVFDKLAAGTYYLAETDAEGNALNADDADVFFTHEIRDGVITLPVTPTNEKATIINYIDTPPDGFLLKDDGSIEIDKTVVAGEEEKAVTETFYFTLYGDEDMEDIIETRSLSLEEASAGTVLFEELAYGTYYIAESDAEGIPVDNDFAYVVSLSTDAVVLKDAETVSVEITNDSGKEGVDGIEDPNDDNKKTPKSTITSTKTPKSNSGTSSKSSGSKTGDTSQPIIYLIVLLGATMVIAGIVITRRRVKKQ